MTQFRTSADAARESQVKHWQEFVSVLESERDALVANDGDQIAGLAERKAECAQRLTGIRPAAPEAIALARRARALNQANGALLQQRLAQTQQALALLRRSSNVGPRSDGYGPDGRVSPRDNLHREFTRA